MTLPSLEQAPVAPPGDTAPARRPMVLHTRVVTETGGGPEKTIFNSPRFLVPYGYDSICAYMHPPDDPGFEMLKQKAAEADAPLVGIEDRGPLDWRTVRHMVRLCRRHCVDIWHGHDYKSNVLGLIVRRFQPMRLVSTVHGWNLRTRRASLYYWIDRMALRHYDRVVCVSDDLHECCLAAKVSAQRCRVIENAIDTEQYARRMSTDEAKRRLDFEPNRLLIGAVGRLSAEKNFAGLIEAVERLLRKGLDVQLMIVGDGDQRGPLEGLIAQRGLGDRVRLLGFRSDTIDLYQAMDIYALSSLREGLPNVLLEAMALEVPVLATRIAGVPKLVRHQTDGLLVEPGDVDALTAGLQSLAVDEGLRTQLAAAGRRRIEQSYSFAARMAAMRAVYDEVLGGKGSP